MARAGLGWPVTKLAEWSGISYPTLHRFEQGLAIAEKNRRKLQDALAAAGVTFGKIGEAVMVTVPE